jgi:hypothetical protein
MDYLLVHVYAYGLTINNLEIFFLMLVKRKRLRYTSDNDYYYDNDDGMTTTATMGLVLKKY